MQVNTLLNLVPIILSFLFGGLNSCHIVQHVLLVSIVMVITNSVIRIRLELILINFKSLVGPEFLWSLCVGPGKA
jgi:hypothetical protein